MTTLFDPSNSSQAENLLTVAGDFRSDRNTTTLVFPDGRVLRIDTRLLDPSDIPAGAYQPSIAEVGGEGVLIPLIEEQLHVGKRTIETGKVLLQKSVENFETALNEPLAVRTYDVERMLKNEPVEAAPPVRQEGDRTIYSLVEERLILTKQLVLREEVHLVRRDTERIDTQVVTLKREHLVVEREDLTNRTT